MACHHRVMHEADTGVYEKNTPPDKNNLGSVSLKNTTSGGGEQLLLLFRKAKARSKGVFLFTASK